MRWGWGGVPGELSSFCACGCFFFPYSSTSGVDSNRSRVFPTPSPPALASRAPSLLAFHFIPRSPFPVLCVYVCMRASVPASMAVGTVPATTLPSAMPSAASATSLCHLQLTTPQYPSSPTPSPQSLISY